MGKEIATFLFIDGTNLYAAQYELFGPQHYLHFGKLIRQLEENIKTHFNKIYFYVSYSPRPSRPNTKEKQYLKNEALFYRSVKNTSKVIFFQGYRSKSSGKEKEVDVKLAGDIIDLAHRNKYKKLFLLSGDADFMQALHIVKSLSISISVLCMENKIMYKALLFYNTTFVRFKSQKIQLRKVRKQPQYLDLERK